MNPSFLDRVSPYLLLVLAASFWGGNFNIARAFNLEIPPMGLSFWRWAVAGLISLPFVWRPMRQQWPACKQHFPLVFALGILGVAGFNTLVYLGLQTTTATNGVLMQSVNPIFIIILSSLLLGEFASKRQWLGIFISLLGVLAILIQGQLANLLKLDFHAGDLIILLAVLDWSLYTVLLRKLPNELKGLPILGYTIAIGVLGILPLYLYEAFMTSRSMPVNWISISSVLYVAIFPSVLSYLFWNHGTQRIGANRAGQFAHVVPISGIIIAVLLLGEQLHLYHLLGISLVAVGIVLANYRHKTG
ncbi:MAG: DMT family transporter [Thiolinea sp.]